MVLADEPVASLDPVLAHSIMSYLEAINQEDGVTVLCSLHFLDLVHRYGQRVIALNEGELVFEGPPNKSMTSGLERFTDRRPSELADRDAKATGEETPSDQTPSQTAKKRPRRTLWLIIGILAGLVVYAYAFETTEVSLAKIRDETRQEQLVRVLRALAQPGSHRLAIHGDNR